MRVVSWSPACSASSTMATTYGTGTLGRNAWWLIVNVKTVPLPLSGDGVSSSAVAGSSAGGGCSHSPVRMFFSIHSAPSSCAVQKNSDSGVILGKGPARSTTMDFLRSSGAC